MGNEVEFEGLMQAFEVFDKERNRLACMAKEQYEPIVDAIIRGRVTDSKRIERTLDWILDFCFDDGMLEIFKRLCRYYYYINPGATAFYVTTYRDMWDSDPEVGSSEVASPEACQDR